MPGAAPLEALAADWKAPRDVIFRQPFWITFPGCQCASTNQITQSCRVAAQSILSSVPFLVFSGVCPSPKPSLQHHSGDPFTVRQAGRWAIWSAVTLCLFLCCRAVRKDKTCSAAFALSSLWNSWRMRKVWLMGHAVKQTGPWHAL